MAIRWVLPTGYVNQASVDLNVSYKTEGANVYNIVNLIKCDLPNFVDMYLSMKIG